VRPGNGARQRRATVYQRCMLEAMELLMMHGDRIRAAAFLVSSAAGVIIGCGNVLAARGDALQQMSVNPKAGPVGGWDTTRVVLVAAAALLLLAITAWSIDRRGAWWGVLCAVLALVPLAVLWLDRYAVSQTPGVIEGGGPGDVWNRAAQYLDHASLLFLAAGALCIAALFFFHGRLNPDNRYRARPPAQPLLR
jgi:hypothetical protein